jgi:hypothetical protein
VAQLVIALLAAIALWMTRRASPADATIHAAADIPALRAAPEIKLRVFYVGLLISALVCQLPHLGDTPYYLVLLLLFAGIPILGHQTIGLTPARTLTWAARRLWVLGVLYPLFVLALGATLLMSRADLP